MELLQISSGYPTTPSVVTCLQDFDEWCVTTLAAQSSKLLGSQLSVDEVRHRFQPTLRIHEASGSQSLRLKINTTGRAAVRIWSPLGGTGLCASILVTMQREMSHSP